MKKLFIFNILLLAATMVMGQTDFDKEWAEVKGLVSKHSYSTAYQKGEKLFAAAQKEKNSRNMLVGAYQLAVIGNMYREDHEDSLLARYERILPKLNDVDKAICNTLLALFYADYKDDNRWTIRNNEETDEADLDYKLWPESRFEKAVAAHLEQAMKNEELLKKTPVESIREFCTEPSDISFNTTPTLYDVVVNVAIENSKVYTTKMELLGKLADFHKDDGDCIKLYLEQKRLDMLKRYAPSGSVSEADYQRVVNQYRGTACDLICGFYYDMANNTKDFVQAVRYCDTALALYPESEGGVRCYSLRNSILHKSVRLGQQCTSMADRDVLSTCDYRNTNKIYFRIVKYAEIKDYDNDKVLNFLLNQPVVHSWSQDVPDDGDHKERTAFVYQPAVPTGTYYLLASTSENFKDDRCVYVKVECCDASFISAQSKEKKAVGYLVSRKTGAPIVGQKVELGKYDYYRRKKVSVGSPVKTDATGYFELSLPDKADIYYSSFYYMTTYDGFELAEDISISSPSCDRGVRADTYTYVDRPVYKPGEVVSFSVLTYKTDGKTVGETVEGADVRVELQDVNRKVIDTVWLKSDDYGVAKGSFKIPEQSLPGRFGLNVLSIVSPEMKAYDCVYIRVEAYKQPKFMVTMNGDKNRHAFGEKVSVQGAAVSYSAVPISGANVKYTVTRKGYRNSRPWEWGWYPSVTAVVAEGELTTDGEGRFSVDFVAEPDSSLDLTNKPCFEYLVNVDVTDINGESHPQSYRTRVGYASGYLAMSLNERIEKWDKLSLGYYNMDGDNMDGKVNVTIEKLKEPAIFHLDGEYKNSNLAHTMDRDEFERRYPQYAYSSTEYQPETWAVERNVLKTVVACTAEEGGELEIPPMESGWYRVRISMTDALGEELSTEQITYLQKPTDKKVKSPSLLWTHMDKNTYEAGVTAEIKVGSRYNNVTVYYALYLNKKEVDRKLIKLNDEVKTIAIPIKKEYIGDINVELIAVKENVECSDDIRITVPYSDKKLNVKFETFRNKLEPGGKETWTISIKDNEQKGLKSNLLMTMYDEALSNYGSLYWPSNPWVSNYSPARFDWNRDCNTNRPLLLSPLCKRYGGKRPGAWVLQTALYGGYSRAYMTGDVRMKSANAGSARGEDGMVYEMAPAVEEEVLADGVVGAVLGLSADNEESSPVENVVMESDEARGEQDATKDGKIQIRENLSTLAFFEPQLRSNEDGVVEVSFTVPELLTEWTIKGLAHTKDMKTGTVSNSLITQKELMVQPNMPRFLRHGDRIDLLAKVSNLTDENQKVTVTFELTDAATGKAIGTYAEKVLTINRSGSESVSFSVEVPSDVFVAQYRIVAKNDSHSDGEQGLIPVITNRQLVTTSQAMYMNGAGEKTYSLNPILNNIATSNTHQPHMLKVEFTPNAIWYAVQALPYVQEHQNPSNIYLANAVYSNSVSLNLVKNNPSIETIFKQWEKDTVNPLVSQLEKNSDVKQAVLEETPWLRDGTGETERMHRIAKYFDEKNLNAEVENQEHKLFADQRSDGGWSWMPGGSFSSEYTTQYILKTYGELRNTIGKINQSSKLKKALDYIEKEEYEYYKRYLKNDIYEVINLDYLYLRSLYADEHMSGKVKEMYDYFYKNALKNYRKFENLYTQAEMALVFYRKGDKKEAQDLIRLLKEKALYSDEMGMYWRDNMSSWFWYQRPIETQAMLIRAFSEVTPTDTVSVELMQQWLLKQKQTTHWGTDVSTVNAIMALMKDGRRGELETTPATIFVAGEQMSAPNQAGTGYVSQTWTEEDLMQKTEQIKSGTADVVIKKLSKGVAWGAAYYQYFEDMDKIPANDMGVSLQKTFYKVENDKTLTAIQGTGKGQLAVGDKVRVRLLVSVDRNLEFVEIKDGRASCMEPVSTASGWHWNQGLSYYMAVSNASTSFYADRLDKGKYIIEYDLYVTNAGTFSAGLTTAQCMYAPEFRANTQGVRLIVK